MLTVYLNMIYKFPKPANLFKELLPTYKGTYIELCVPDNEDEKYCYIEFSEIQFQSFLQHFGDNGLILENNTDEYPASRQSKTNNRIERFTIVRPVSSSKVM